jgi:hypothetical protein
MDVRKGRMALKGGKGKAKEGKGEGQWFGKEGEGGLPCSFSEQKSHIRACMMPPENFPEPHWGIKPPAEQTCNTPNHRLDSVGHNLAWTAS